MIIEFLYFDGCPSYKSALEYVKEIIKEDSLQTELKLINVESPDLAKEVGFQGSPSIRVDGKDLEGRNDGFSYNCRIYTINGEMTGTPSKQFIRQKLNGLLTV